MTSETLTPLTHNPNHAQTMTVLKNSQYLLQTCIEQNAVAQIYQGFNLQSNQPVLIYTLSFNLKKHPEFNHWKKQFFYYILLLRSCLHSSLPTILDSFEQDGHPYLVYENYQGISLEELIKQKNQGLTPHETIKYIKHIAQGLKVLHQKGLIHHNVQPRNIIIDQQKGTIKLINFGFYFNFTPKIQQFYSDLLTEGYSPLEHYQIEGAITPATDIYSLSATFFYLLTGHKPLSVSQRNKIAWTDWQTFSPKFPDPIRKALLKGLSINIEARCQTLDQWFALMTNSSEENSPMTTNIAQPDQNYPVNSETKTIRFTNLNPVQTVVPENLIIINKTPEIKVNPPQSSSIKNQSKPKNQSNHQSNHQPKIQKKSPQSRSHHYYELKELLQFMILTCAIAASGGFGFACSFALNRPTEAGATILHSEQTFPPKEDWPIYTNPNIN